MGLQMTDIPCGDCGQHTPIYYVYGGRGLWDRPPATSEAMPHPFRGGWGYANNRTSRHDWTGWMTIANSRDDDGKVAPDDLDVLSEGWAVRGAIRARAR